MITNRTKSSILNARAQKDAPLCPHCGRELQPNTFFSEYRGQFVQFGWIDCECEDAKREREQEQQENERKEQEERDQKRARLLRKAGVGARYFDAKTANSSELAGKILDEKCNLFITGNVGSGKTYLASAILGELVFKKTCKFAFFNTLVNDLMRYHDETAGSLMDACKRCGVLVIDDIGKENMSDFVVSQIFELVNERNANMRPTIVTSNFSVAELEKRLASKGNTDAAKAVISRLTDNCRILKLQHEDRRRKSRTRE